MLTEMDKCILNEVPKPPKFGWSGGVKSFEHGIIDAIKENVMDYEDACVYAMSIGATANGLNHWLNKYQGTSDLIYIS